MQSKPGKRVGLGRVGPWVKTGSGQNESITKKGCFGSGRNGFRSERVRVETGWVSGPVGSGWLTIAFFKRVVLIVCIGG
ncbi:hypothetical protein Hanom_Chr09g00848811 [Helianthus anomalus]